MTLSLMVLLTVLIVGLLSLSAISLRAASQHTAIAVARANARMALVLALGDLQKSMGPDKMISAVSNNDGSASGKPNLTGVWQSWNYNPNIPGLDYSGEKLRRFQRWLVSDTDRSATTNRAYSASGFSGDAIELVGKGSLGGLEDESLKVSAGRIGIVHNGKREGSFAWHVADEAVKARVNSYRDPGQNPSLAQQRALLTGHRPDVSSLVGIAQNLANSLPTDDTPVNFAKAQETSGKLIDSNQMDLVAGGRRIAKLRNAVTPYSLGVLSDVRHGGLKEDLTSIFEGATMPAKYSAQKLYASTHKITGVSDPAWGILSSYYNIYKKIKTPDISPTYSDPPDDPVSISDAESQIPATGFYPGPVITKVEILFTFVTRDAHWSSILGQGMSRMGHLVFVPIVTLHNPYNISISFDRMQVVIRNPPVAFNFSVNGQVQNTILTPFTEMLINNGRGSDDRGEKSFALDIGNWSSSDVNTSTGPIVLNPGQTMVSSPYINPAASFGNKLDAKFDDWANDATGVDGTGNVVSMIKAMPGLRGKGVGFDIDWLTPMTLILNTNDQGAGVLGLHPDDIVQIECGIKPPDYGMKDRFQVTASIVYHDKTVSYGGLDFVYGDAANLGKFFPKTFFYPQQGGFRADDAYHSNRVPLAAQFKAKSFGLFSAYARTTSGGVYETGLRSEVPGALNALRDGRLAGKPFVDHNPARPVVMVDLQKDVPGMHSHELNFVPLSGEIDDVFEVDASNRSNVITGNTTTRGIKSGTYLELPTGPMMTIADFRRSNALTTPFLPNFVQPVANSRVSPLMSTDKVVEPGVTTYPLLDTSVLANHAFYDKFFFSTLAPMYGKSTEKVLGDFLDGKASLWSQALQAYLPAGRSNAAAATELVAAGKPSPTAYQLAAEYLMVRGPFNVNSTSVDAWKAVLSALNKSPIPVLWPKNLDLTSETPYNTPILPMSLLNGGSATDGAINPHRIDNFRANEWNGYRELSDPQMDALATAIVDQVKLRGPFLSLSEFVNRRIGPDSEMTRNGALQVAIEKSKINSGVFAAQVPITSVDIGKPTLYKYKTMGNVLGNPAEGAPGWISQGDLMRIIEPLATVRADTFVIRTCGEATDAVGKVTARAYAEAVVQRLPEYVNPVDRPSLNVYDDPSANPMNRSFGRRFKIVSFRWLSSQEI